MESKRSDVPFKYQGKNTSNVLSSLQQSSRDAPTNSGAAEGQICGRTSQGFGTVSAIYRNVRENVYFMDPIVKSVRFWCENGGSGFHGNILAKLYGT